jgi:hypothetical protein
VVSTVRKAVWVAWAVMLLVALGGPSATGAPPVQLPDIGSKFYYSRELVFVDFINPYFAPVNNIIVDMIVRDGTGANRVIAIGQSRLAPYLVLQPGEHTSTRVPIRARVSRTIPPNADFQFRIMARQVDPTTVPPEVVVQGGDSLAVTKDINGVPNVLGFAGLDPLAPEDAQVTVQLAILTFYDQNHRISWTEFVPVAGTITPFDSLPIIGKFANAAGADIDTTYVDVKFVTLPTQQ